MTRLTLAVGLLALTGMGPRGGVAQAQVPDLGLTTGDRIRVTWCDEAAARCDVRRRADGRLLGRDSVTLRFEVARESLHVPWHSVRRVEVYRGTHGALRTVLFGVGGFVVGGLAGIAIGAVAQGDCYELDCLAGPFYGVLVGAPAGLFGGIGLAVATRHRWATAYEPSTLPAARQEAPGAGRRVAIGITIPVGW